MAELLPWQQGLWSRLQSSSRAHAWLLHGPAGTGKRLLAERAVATRLCSAGAAAPCGQCKSCLLLQAGTHPDYVAVLPDEEGKQIRIDQIRELVDFIARTPQMGGSKLVLIDPLESLNLNAANALLKSLEEPSGNTLLLLVSHQPSLLLPTIRSRCLQLACPLPDSTQALGWLQAKLPELDEAAARELLTLAAGSPLRALGLQRAGTLQRRHAVEEQLKLLLKGQALPAQLAEDWKDIDLLLLLDWFCAWLLDILRLQMTADESLIQDQRMGKVIDYLARRARPEQVLELQDWLLAERQKVLGRGNLNRALLCEALLVRWARLLRAG